MAEITRKRLCWTDPECNNGDTFVACNLNQLEPHTAICAGKTGLTFRDCRLVNCDVPADAVVNGGCRGHVSYCTHLNPDLIALGLTECVEDCEHVVTREDIEIDGVVVGTFYTYADGVAE